MAEVKACNKLTLKELRKRLGLNQSSFAQALNVSRETISFWERGIYRPALSIEQIKILEGMLGAVGLRFKDLPDDVSQ